MNYPSSDETVTRKYAQAFITVFSPEITLDDIQKIEIAENYLRTNKKILTLLSIPLLDEKIQQTMIADLINHFSLKKYFSPLFSLILSRRHSLLIPDIFWYISQLYKEQHEIIDCAIISSHNLTQTTIDSIKRFFEHITGKNAIYSHMIDKKLIAGIRLQSLKCMWEYSVHKQIQSIAHGSESRG